jgi:hypothetical protein
MARGKKKTDSAVLMTADQIGSLTGNVKKDILGKIENCLLSKRLIDTEKENIKDILDSLEATHGVSKKLATKFINAFHSEKLDGLEEEVQFLMNLREIVENGTTAEEESKKKGMTAADVLSGN